jgi:hypothetical protein
MEVRLNSRAEEVEYGHEIYGTSVYFSICFIFGLRANRVIAVERRYGHSSTTILIYLRRQQCWREEFRASQGGRLFTPPTLSSADIDG